MDEAFGVKGVGAGEGVVADGGELLDLAMVDGRRGEEGEAAVAVFAVPPRFSWSDAEVSFEQSAKHFLLRETYRVMLAPSAGRPRRRSAAAASSTSQRSSSGFDQCPAAASDASTVAAAADDGAYVPLRIELAAVGPHLELLRMRTAHGVPALIDLAREAEGRGLDELAASLRDRKIPTNLLSSAKEKEAEEAAPPPAATDAPVDAARPYEEARRTIEALGLSPEKHTYFLREIDKAHEMGAGPRWRAPLAVPDRTEHVA